MPAAVAPAPEPPASGFVPHDLHAVWQFGFIHAGFVIHSPIDSLKLHNSWVSGQSGGPNGGPCAEGATGAAAAGAPLQPEPGFDWTALASYTVAPHVPHAAAQ